MTDSVPDRPNTDQPAEYEHSGRVIDLQIEVPGTPEEVWRAIATGPGISSWYVHHEVEERAGGAVEFSFGPEMSATGRVAIWEPPHRIVIDNAEQVGLAFEWIVEARDGASCVVRLVNSGFGTGEEWDDQYDGMANGWGIFFTNLRLHLQHFGGRSARPSLPMAMWDGPQSAAWIRLLGDLGLPPAPALGERVSVRGDDLPPFAGTVAAVADDHLALVLDEPAEGTAFLAAESVGGAISVSIWSYLYDDDGAAASERDEPRWREWLQARAGDAPSR